MAVPISIERHRNPAVLPAIGSNIDRLVWGPYLQNSGRAGRLVATVLQYVYGILRDVVYGQLTLRSMSLVYTTLLSVVPLIAFSFSVLKGFGVQEQLEPLLFDFLAPLGDRGDEIRVKIMDMVENVNEGLLGGIALAFFIYTAISMVQKVEESLNYVWYVSEPRSFTRRFTEYTIILLIGPLVVVIALGILTSIQNERFVQALLSSSALSPVVVAFGKLTPYLLITLVFTSLYKYMPNTKVRFSAALVGGLAGGFLWVAMGAFFTSFLVESQTSNAVVVYRGFAVAVLALIWLYLNWLVLLIGAQVAFYFQKPAYLRLGRREPRLSNGARERLALNIMFLVGKTFRDPQSSITVADLSSRLKIPSLTMAPVLRRLEKAGLLLATENESLIPCRDLALIRLRDILDVVRRGGVTGSDRDPSWSPEVEELAGRIDGAIGEAVGETTLAEFLEPPEDDA